MLPFLRLPFARQPSASRAAFADWLGGDEGKALLAAEQRALDDLLPRLVGCRALQLGLRADTDLLASCQLPFQWRLSSLVHDAAHLLMQPASLPLASSCVDLVLLHHSLDFDDDPYRILNEAGRVLNPGGTLLVVGFNPLSLLGLKRFFHDRASPPWSGRFLRAGRVSDWVGVCGLELQGYVSGFYGQRGLAQWLGHHLWQRLGGFYVLVARKQAVPMQPLLARLRLLGELPPNVITVPAARWQQRTRNPFETGNHLQ
jgi:SAM-dependent methyltransferase